MKKDIDYLEFVDGIYYFLGVIVIIMMMIKTPIEIMEFYVAYGYMAIGGVSFVFLLAYYLQKDKTQYHSPWKIAFLVWTFIGLLLTVLIRYWTLQRIVPEGEATLGCCHYTTKEMFLAQTYAATSAIGFILWIIKNVYFWVCDNI